MQTIYLKKLKKKYDKRIKKKYLKVSEQDVKVLQIDNGQTNGLQMFSTGQKDNKSG